MSATTRHFARHYVEMVVAMFLGMGADMTAAMAIPTLTVLALLWTGLVGGLGTLLLIEHVAMLPSMLVAMLLRRDEYTGAAHGHARQQVAA